MQRVCQVNRIMILLTTITINGYCFASTNCQQFDELPIANLSATTFNPNKLALVDKQIESDIVNGFPGVELIIIQNNQLIKHNVYGYKLRYNESQLSLSNPQFLQCGDLFDLASNTKMYATNYAIMHLVYQGKLDLNKPIHDYIPEYTGCDSHGECRNSRTVLDLLTHRAGYMPDPQFFDPKAIAKYGKNLYSQDALRTQNILLTKLPFQSARSGKPIYSDVDFMLLGILIERITHQSLDEYVAHNIYQALNLKHTMFNPLEHSIAESSCAATELMGNTRAGTRQFPNIRRNVLQCQVHDEKAFYSMGGVSGHAGLFSNGYDMIKLTQLMANNGSYQKVTLWDNHTENLFVAGVPNSVTYGLGWRRAGNHEYEPFGHYASDLAYGHTGWTGTLTLFDPKYNLTIILLTNKRHTPIVNGVFLGDNYATGKYYPIIDLIYQSFLHQNKSGFN